jgi:hypothetical protein
MNRPKFEVADIFRDPENLPVKLLPEQRKVVNALLNCRTAHLGGHKHSCNKCDYEEQSYNSCGNRHCPKCGALAKEKWLNARMKELLPVEYFHIVFTVPHKLNELFLYNKKTLYSTLLKSVQKTITQAAADEKSLGVLPGFIDILHTWGQNLQFHPHVHCIVPGGGLKNNKWISAKKGYFLPVKKLSKIFRGIFLKDIKKLYKKNELELPPEKYEDFREYNFFISQLYRTEWVVYSKKPFSRPKMVLKYLSRYTHRVAISNFRIKNITEKEVSFLWKDYRTKKNKVMTLSKKEFIRRFLLHVLPKRFVKIRSCGFLCNRKKKDNLKLCRELLNVELAESPSHEKLVRDIWEGYKDDAKSKNCPLCKTGKLIVSIVAPFYRR